jgi:hypothetical protein
VNTIFLLELLLFRILFNGIFKILLLVLALSIAPLIFWVTKGYKIVWNTFIIYLIHFLGITTVVSLLRALWCIFETTPFHTFAIILLFNLTDVYLLGVEGFFGILRLDTRFLRLKLLIWCKLLFLRLLMILNWLLLFDGNEVFKSKVVCLGFILTLWVQLLEGDTLWWWLWAGNLYNVWVKVSYFRLQVAVAFHNLL